MTVAVNARPLGVLPEVPLTNAQFDALQRLEAYDLAAIEERLLYDEVLPAAWIDDAIYEFRRFLGLNILTDERVPMCSEAVDEVWHACLVFTRLYVKLCSETVGYFVHHEPGTWQEEWGVEAFSMFADVYRRYYGETTRLWRFPALWWTRKMALRRRDER